MWGVGMNTWRHTLGNTTGDPALVLFIYGTMINSAKTWDGTPKERRDLWLNYLSLMVQWTTQPLEPSNIRSLFCVTLVSRVPLKISHLPIIKAFKFFFKKNYLIRPCTWHYNKKYIFVFQNELINSLRCPNIYKYVLVISHWISTKKINCWFTLLHQSSYITVVQLSTK